MKRKYPALGRKREKGWGTFAVPWSDKSGTAEGSTIDLKEGGLPSTTSKRKGQRE